MKPAGEELELGPLRLEDPMACICTLTGGVKIIFTETGDLGGEEKAARLAVGPRYNGAGFEIVCTPPLLTI